MVSNSVFPTDHPNDDVRNAVLRLEDNKWSHIIRVHVRNGMGQQEAQGI